METMYVLKWDPDDTNTDTYGAQISYQNDGSVHYQNELQPAGKKIHWWETHFYGDPDPLKASRYGSKRLPQLPRYQNFSLSFKGEAIPKGSIGLAVMSFDSGGQLLDQKMTLKSEIDFELTDNEPEYEVALVKFNNTQLLFRGLLLIPETIKNHYQIEPHFEQGYIDIIPRDISKVGNGEIIVHEVQRVVDAITLPNQKLRIPLRVVMSNGSWNSEQLQKIGNDFKKQFQREKVDWIANGAKAQDLLDTTLKRK